MDVAVKRAYDKPANRDGHRVLVDRLWPRGVSRDEARIDAWRKELAPSDELRRWFDHDPEKWDEFRKTYHKELGDRDDAIEQLRSIAREKRVTLVYGAADERHNNAVALKEYIEND